MDSSKLDAVFDGNDNMGDSCDVHHGGLAMPIMLPAFDENQFGNTGVRG